ncbi:hypothetical protein P4S73_17580 [Paraglaciecola sp. Hal342]
MQTDELDTSFVASKGDGVFLHKMQTNSKQGANLRSTQDYRDVHITLDFNLTKGSRSALYLLGRYRLNITDIYGSRNLWPSLMGELIPAMTKSENGRTMMVLPLVKMRQKRRASGKH